MLLKKYENSDKNLEILDMIFKATYDNAKFIDLLSLDSIPKMKSRFIYDNKKADSKNSIIRFGDFESATTFIKNWITDNNIRDLILVDPYFTEKDLTFIQMLQEINSNIGITILTSKENGNSHDNNELEYIAAWQKISVESPPLMSINIASIQSSNEKNKKSPFHDRWIIDDQQKTGLRLGTSINSLGLSKDSEISVMSEEETIKVHQTIIFDYLIKRERRLGENLISYSSFDLISV